MDKRAPVAILIWLAVTSTAFAVQPDEILPDAGLEARARNLSAGLRCLVCQNQSIDDSDAPLAKDLRVLVRERLRAGETDEQVRSYIVDRYGEYVLLEPPFSWHTLALWLTPLLALAGAAWVVALGMRRGSAPSKPPAVVLSPEEQRRVEEILKR